jgi:hypothetical protein
MENSDIVVTVVTDLKILARLFFSFLYLHRKISFLLRGDFTLLALEKINNIENNSQLKRDDDDFGSSFFISFHIEEATLRCKPR